MCYERDSHPSHAAAFTGPSTYHSSLLFRSIPSLTLTGKVYNSQENLAGIIGVTSETCKIRLGFLFRLRSLSAGRRQWPPTFLPQGGASLPGSSLAISTVLTRMVPGCYCLALALQYQRTAAVRGLPSVHPLHIPHALAITPPRPRMNFKI